MNEFRRFIFSISIFRYNDFRMFGHSKRERLLIFKFEISAILNLYGSKF